MKMKMFSLLLKMLLLSFIIISVTTKEDEPALVKNQYNTYPNTYEAPGSSAEFPNNKYAAPKFSSALSEHDPNKKLRKSEFLDIIHFTQYKLTRGETEQIFYFVDANRDDLVDSLEWAQFVSLYIVPFEACDEKGDYLLGAPELKACFEADPRSSYVTFRRRYNEKDLKYEIIKDIVSSRAGGDLNFSDYLFIRKALFGWKECHSNSEYIAKYHFKCALGAALPHKHHTELDSDIIYEQGIKIFGDRSLIENDFISYLGILYYANLFGIANEPLHSIYLEKSQWLKAIREDRFPNNFEESEVEQIYELVGGNPFAKLKKQTVIDFPSFAWFLNLHRMFNMYSRTRPLQLNLEEFKKLLEDPFVGKEIVLSVDASFTKFSESHYQEASLVLQRLRPNERNFFYSFKQDASASSNFSYNIETNRTDYYPMVANDTNREVLFTTISDENKEFITKSNLYRAFQLANFWVGMTGFPVKPLHPSLSVGEIIRQSSLLYDVIKPPISLNQRTNAIFYKSLPNELRLDILTYLAMESFFYKFKIPSISSRNVINEKELKIILKDFGMENLPDTVLDAALKGFDALRRREYIPQTVIKQIIIVQAVASEQMRDSADIINHKLKLNVDKTRRFPGPPRRFSSSPLV